MVTDSDGSLQIQLVDADGIPLSNAYKLQTFNNCQQKLDSGEFQTGALKFRFNRLFSLVSNQHLLVCYWLSLLV